MAAKRKAQEAEDAATQPAERPPGDEPPEGQAAVEPQKKPEPFKSKLPNPQPLSTVLLTDARDGPKARLLRHYAPRQLWIMFPENPGKEITTELHDAGARQDRTATYQEQKGAWIMDVARGAEIRTELDAERLFGRLVNQIRKRNGATPATFIGLE